MKKLIVFLTCLSFGVCLVFLTKTFYIPSNPAQINESLQKTKESTLKMQIINLDKDYRFYDLEIINSKKVWAVGTGGVYLSNEQGITKPVIANYENSYTLQGLDFVDELNGWASGKNYVLRTSDGGDSWKAAKVKTEVEFNSLSFYNDKIGYVGGGNMLQRCRGCEIDFLPAEIWKTKDGGKSWEKCYKSKEYVGSIFDMQAVSESIVVAIINSGTIIRTEDGGRHWKEIAKFKGINDFALSPDGKIWTVGKGYILFSGDKGLTWKTPQFSSPNLEKNEWNTIKFADSLRGMIFGRDRKVAYTKNGGESWKEIKTDVPANGQEPDNLIWASLKDDSGIVIGSKNIYRFLFLEN